MLKVFVQLIDWKNNTIEIDYFSINAVKEFPTTQIGDMGPPIEVKHLVIYCDGSKEWFQVKMTMDEWQNLKASINLKLSLK